MPAKICIPELWHPVLTVSVGFWTFSKLSENPKNMFTAEGKISEALIDAFLELDEEMLKNAEIQEEMSGSERCHIQSEVKKNMFVLGTAVIVMVKNNFIYCGEFFKFAIVFKNSFEFKQMRVIQEQLFR